MTQPTQMQHLSDLLVSGFSDWKSLGDVNVRQNLDGTLTLFNYSVMCTYRRRWNWFERVSRGLILDTKTGEVVARPFDKFFNWGELGEELGEKPQGLPTGVVEKCDGSFGILYREKGSGNRIRIATRGSFDSEQALWATEHLKYYDLEDLPEDLTLLFEIIYPENRIIVDYGDRKDLVLLGVRDRFTGEDLGFEDVRLVAETFGFSVPHIWTQAVPIEEILSRAKKLSSNEEGWVCRFADGTRAKVKGDEYLELARVAKKMTDRFIFDSFATKGFKETAIGAPEEFLPRVEECWEIFSREEAFLYDRVTEALASISGMQTRKEVALHLRANCPNLMSWVMAEYDSRSCRPGIRDHIKKNYRFYLGEERGGKK